MRDAKQAMEQASEFSNQMSENIGDNFQQSFINSVAMPGVRVDREKFLRKLLAPYCDEDRIDKVVAQTPAKAGVNAFLLDKLAKQCIKNQAVFMTGVSALTGIPSGIFGVLAFPVDIVQYYSNLLVIMQKLSYIYGWQNITQAPMVLPDEQMAEKLNEMTQVVFGLENTEEDAAAASLYNSLERKANKKATHMFTVKPMMRGISKRIKNEPIQKILETAVPYYGFAASGIMSYKSFNENCEKLRLYLKERPENER